MDADRVNGVLFKLALAISVVGMGLLTIFTLAT